MEHYGDVDPVKDCQSGGNYGPNGWGFCMWGCGQDDGGQHRRLLTKFARKHPEADLKLPVYQDGEDCVEGKLVWNSQQVDVYFETVLDYLSVWSVDKETIEILRTFLLELA
ncbi:hypothetical protein [Parasphingorhabdus sp.]|uniref:hypothetical protein n=1 Tax=Parasphingorhabdus sp. TaxID=2709688 RepID=UPI003263D708